MTNTCFPDSPKAAARLTAVVDFPTPPFWLMIARVNGLFLLFFAMIIHLLYHRWQYNNISREKTGLFFFNTPESNIIAYNHWDCYETGLKTRVSIT
jgi:hypothetical protein